MSKVEKKTKPGILFDSSSAFGIRKLLFSQASLTLLKFVQKQYSSSSYEDFFDTERIGEFHIEVLLSIMPCFSISAVFSKNKGFLAVLNTILFGIR